MLKVLLYIWQLPQNLIGDAMWLFFKKRKDHANSKTWKGIPLHVHIDVIYGFSGGVSLGRRIYVSPRYSKALLKHELGHSYQSLIYGPLYLLIIGIPSFVMCTLARAGKITWARYNKFYTEKQADKLAKKFVKVDELT